MRRRHPSFGIIGGGFSGSLLAVHLLQEMTDGGRVHLIERRSGFGTGLAYSTGNPGHLLNVRAARMSAFEDDPDHFRRWLASRPEGASLDGAAFVPRGLYGRYVQSLLGDQLANETGNRSLFLFPDEAVDLCFGPQGVTIGMAGGRPVLVDAVVLAVGNFPPELPRGGEGLRDCPGYVADPWDAQAVGAIPPEARVVVIGSGLTMVDFVIALAEQGHRGPITALSRRGLLPHRHADGPAPQPWTGGDAGTLPLSRLLRAVRAAAQAQGDWRAVVDGLRPHVQGWWQAMSAVERRRFLRHLRPWWDIHRHRMAPAVAERLAAAQAAGQLAVRAGKLLAARTAGTGVEVEYRPRGEAAVERLAADYVVNCSGPSTDCARSTVPVVRRLLERGVIRPDEMKLGLDVDGGLHLLDRQGRANPRLYAIGPLTRGQFWECTAVPEIRRQAEWLAGRLVAEWRQKAAAGG